MKELNDKQNDLSLLMDFKKKPKTKPKSERSSVADLNCSTKDKGELTSAALLLLEKKKKYSKAIREKNLNNSQHKKDKHDSCSNRDGLKLIINMDDLRCSSLNTGNLLSPVSEYKYDTPMLGDSASSKISELRIDMGKSKGKEVRKGKKMIEAVSDFREYGISKKRAEITATNRSHVASKAKAADYCNITMFTGLNSPVAVLQPRLTLHSQVVNEVMGPFGSEGSKEMELMQRQNNTFKKDLAHFRKENGLLKRDIDDCKKQYEQLRENYDAIMAESESQLKFIESLQFKPAEPINAGVLPVDLSKETLLTSQLDNGLQQILHSYEARLFESNSANKKLQFRNYMLEKRLMDETQTHKKMLAREISVWKERYMKAKNENQKLKESRGHLLFEISASEDM